MGRLEEGVKVVDCIGKGVRFWAEALGRDGNWITRGGRTEIMGSEEEGIEDLTTEVTGGTGVSIE